MPLLANRLRLQQASPYWRALGIELMQWGGGHSVTRMAASPRIAISDSDQRIDPLALVGLLDDAFSNAIASVLPMDIGMSTLDLRVEFAHGAPPEGTVSAETHIALIGAQSASARVEARDDHGLLATGTALFTLGGYPGGSLPDFDLAGNYDATGVTGPFTRLIGLDGMPGEEGLTGDSPNVIGWEAGKALHGGVVGAVLMASCQGRADAAGERAAGKHLGSLYIRYLRPGSAVLPLRSASQMDRQGRSASFVSARCFHEAGRDIAHAHAVFVPDRAAPQ